jgi:hypothetical protein
MHMSLIQWLVPISIVVLESAIVTVLLQRKLRTEFRCLFVYLTFNIASFFLLAFTVRGSVTVYFYSYWSVVVIGMFLSFAVLYEVFTSALKPYSAVTDLAKTLFRWAAVFLLLTAALTALATNGSQVNKICAAVLLLERSVQLMQCGLLLFMVMFEARLGLSWRSRGMAVAFGLGLSAAIGLSTSYIEELLPSLSSRVDLLDGILRACILGSWVVVLVRPQSQKKTAQDSPKRLILERWNETLIAHSQSSSGTSTVESFLPGIEKTVDRVMARKAVS